LVTDAADLECLSGAGGDGKKAFVVGGSSFPTTFYFDGDAGNRGARLCVGDLTGNRFLSVEQERVKEQAGEGDESLHICLFWYLMNLPKNNTQKTVSHQSYLYRMFYYMIDVFVIY